MPEATSIPVTVLTGYLGVGKTNHEHRRLWCQSALDGLAEAADDPGHFGRRLRDCLELYRRGPDGQAAAQCWQRLGRLVTSVAVHPKNPIVAAGFDEGQVIVCALSRQEKVVRLRWPDWERVTALAWSRDGARLAVGTDAGAVALFDLASPPDRVACPPHHWFRSMAEVYRQDGVECANAHSTRPNEKPAIGRGDLSTHRRPPDPLAPKGLDAGALRGTSADSL